MPTKIVNHNKQILAYLVGIALGDGNLSNPNGRAIRLRISCDLKYPQLIRRIQKSIRAILPQNKVSIVFAKKSNCVDISCYSNQWKKFLPWEVNEGSKIQQNVTIPNWIKEKDSYKILCLRGLIETDGSVYLDRNYKMVMFSTAIARLAQDVYNLIVSLGFTTHLYKICRQRKKPIYRVRISKKTTEFLDTIHPHKN